MGSEMCIRDRYTLETLIQAGLVGLRVVSVDIACNPPTRDSRLMRTMRGYIWRSMRDMLRLSATYAPLRAYLAAATVPIAISFALGVRYLVLVSFVDPTRSHTPSLILLAIFGMLGFLIIALDRTAPRLAKWGRHGPGRLRVRQPTGGRHRRQRRRHG